MPLIEQLIFKHAGLFCILIILANAGVFWWRARAKIAVNPESEDQFRRVIWGFTVLFSIPSALWEAGTAFGVVPKHFHFRYPQDVDPFIIAIQGIVIADFIIFLIWFYLKGGAEFIANNQEVFLRRFFDPKPCYTVFRIKFVFGLILIVLFLSQILPWLGIFHISDFTN